MANNTTGAADGSGGVLFGSRRNLLIAHAIGLIFVTICLGAGYSAFMTEWEFWRNGVARNATVTSKETTAGPAGRPGTPPSKNYTVWYRYQDDEGQEHTGSGNVVQSLWNQLQQGQPVEINWLRDQPAKSTTGH